MLIISAQRFVVLFAIVAVIVSAFVVQAWSGPSQSPPNGNVSAPVNVGTSDQVKNAGLSVNALAVFGASSFTGAMNVSNNVTANGFFHNSDRTLKNNIEAIRGMDILNALNGVSFEWKNTGERAAGVIAQDVETVMPYAVHTDADGVKSVEYDQLIAVLIEAVKEQQIEIDALKARIAELE